MDGRGTSDPESSGSETPACKARRVIQQDELVERALQERDEGAEAEPNARKRKSPPGSRRAADTRQRKPQTPEYPESPTVEYDCVLGRTKTAPEVHLKNAYFWKDELGVWQEQRGQWVRDEEADSWRKSGQVVMPDGTSRAKWRLVKCMRWDGWIQFEGTPYPSGSEEYNSDCRCCRERRARDKDEIKKKAEQERKIDDAMEALMHCRMDR